ncbi:MAG: ribose 5-phosphate isomerase B [Melioribacteraceae bacterium]|nr:ribose 5-phosphate isomerase B [Melioribacteraceae bacterium]MCF8354868.1 ribose 5-phosphate isomerase B [Melioribacteraceae bacterium]MCF8392975.1 ribose 5-phosphate isomerase B [Melioribacteraceae bacterium]MCF8417282.1 ribose 5-phosphate isomerase B [Melioribacteraceae bacterium]
MKRLITESDILELIKYGGTVLTISDDSIITPLAQDRILHNKILVERGKEKIITNDEIISVPDSNNRIIAIGGDHTGFEIKSEVIKYLNEKGYDPVDCGTYSNESCDYPDFAFAVAKKVVLNEAGAGMVLDATGIPSVITANKIPGIRAVTCYNEFSARSSREHNDANVLGLGCKTLGIETIKSILDVWLSTAFAGGRHQRRLDKIAEIEKIFLKF